MTAPTPPKAAANRAGGATAATRSSNGTTSATGAQAALHAVELLKTSVDQLEQELQTYNDPASIGRDVVLLQSFFSQIVGRTMQVAQACKIQWSPTTGSNAAVRR